MSKGRVEKGQFDLLNRARDELFSHIQRCGVLEASKDQQDEWIRDTMGYMRERFPDLDSDQLEELEKLGRRYCQPVIPHGA